MFSEGNINHIGNFFFYRVTEKKEKKERLNPLGECACQSQPLWIWLKSCKYCFPRKVYLGLMMSLLVQISSGALSNSRGRMGNRAKAVIFQLGIEVAI